MANAKNLNVPGGIILPFIAPPNATYGELSIIQAQVEQKFTEQFAQFELLDSMQKVVDYAIFPGGKRLRPILALTLCKDLAAENHQAYEKLLQVVFALELLHCASLIHDDLPALDNDDLRRGKTACHKKFDEANAILAGDLMIPLAIDLLSTSSFSDAEKISLINCLTKAYIDLCQGQQLDLLPHSSQRDVRFMQALKTGALFAAACSFTAIALRLPDSGKLAFHQLGLEIGALYQIFDDYLDISPDPSLKGRGASSDIKNKKYTIATSSSENELAEMLQIERQRVSNSLIQISQSYSQGQNSVNSPALTLELLQALF